jgi:polyisoprenoid-binding protein YceI
MRNRFLLAPLIVIVVVGTHAHPTRATETRVDLVSGPSAVDIRIYRLGLFPLDGQFARFHGWLTYDPANHTDCRVQLRVDVTGLTMPSSVMRERILGPEFLDAARYPTFAFDGACTRAGVAGDLALHGVTHPFMLALDWHPASVTAIGSLRRAAW